MSVGVYRHRPPAFVYLRRRSQARPTAAGTQNRTLTGLASTTAFGTFARTPGQISRTLTGFANSQSFGTFTRTPGVLTRSLTGKASTTTFGVFTHDGQTAPQAPITSVPFIFAPYYGS